MAQPTCGVFSSSTGLVWPCKSMLTSERVSPRSLALAHKLLPSAAQSIVESPAQPAMWRTFSAPPSRGTNRISAPVETCVFPLDRATILPSGDSVQLYPSHSGLASDTRIHSFVAPLTGSNLKNTIAPFTNLLKTRLRWRPSALKIIDPRLLEKHLRRSSRKRYVHHTHHPRAEFMTCFRLGQVLSVRLYCCPSLCMAAIVFAFRRWRFIREENLCSLRIQAQDVCGIRCSNHLFRRSRINVLPEYVKTSVTVRHIQNGFAVRRPLVRAILQFVQRQSLQRADLFRPLIYFRDVHRRNDIRADESHALPIRRNTFERFGVGSARDPLRLSHGFPGAAVDVKRPDVGFHLVRWLFGQREQKPSISRPGHTLFQPIVGQYGFRLSTLQFEAFQLNFFVAVSLPENCFRISQPQAVRRPRRRRKHVPGDFGHLPFVISLSVCQIQIRLA